MPWASLSKYMIIAGLVAAVAGLLWWAGYLSGSGPWKARYEQHVAMQEFSAKFQADAWAKALVSVKAEQQEIVHEMAAKLKAAEDRQQPVKVVIKEVTKYVTSQADANCSVTDGFVWVYNSSLQLPTATELAGSKPRDVDAPSGITLSSVGAVAGENNTECVLRGEVIDAWQKWYLRNKASFDRLRLAAP